MLKQTSNTKMIYLISGIILMLLVGFHNSWSIYADAILGEFSWSSAAISVTFTIHMISFCIAGIISGVLSRKINIRINLRIGAGCLLVGFILAAMCKSNIVLYLGYGILNGFGSGISYNSTMNILSKWFAKKQSLISGILLMSFGIGGFILGKIFIFVTTGQTSAWRNAFLFFGVLVFGVIICFSFLLRLPNQDETEKITASEQNNFVKNGVEADVKFMLQRKTFWCFYIWACFLGFIGMVIISQAALIVGSVSAQLTGADLTTIVGLVSIFNGIGRVLFGGIFYKLGTKKIMRIVCGLFFLSGMIIMIAILNSNIVILTASFITAGLSYGGVMSTSSAFINAYYGRINYAANYSVMNTSLIIASFGGTLAGWLHDLSGSYFSLTGLLLSIAATSLIFTFGVKDP